MIKQQQQSQQTLQESEAQSQATVQAQADLQQQSPGTLEQQLKTLHDSTQAVQQQQIEAALQPQSSPVPELEQQAQQQSFSVRAPAAKVKMPRSRPRKPRGRMTPYACFLQTCREEIRKKNPDENVIFTTFSKNCALRWSTMSQEEKQKFQEMSVQDKRRYELEMKNYVPPKCVDLRKHPKRHTKDPNAPKRSLCSFFCFCNGERSKVKIGNPEYKMRDIAKELGRRWATADRETKSKYEALSELDKARYDQEMIEYNKRLALEEKQQRRLQMEEDISYDEDEEYN